MKLLTHHRLYFNFLKSVAIPSGMAGQKSFFKVGDGILENSCVYLNVRIYILNSFKMVPPKCLWIDTS